jgi:hypothetical protein
MIVSGTSQISRMLRRITFCFRLAEDVGHLHNPETETLPGAGLALCGASDVRVTKNSERSFVLHSMLDDRKRDPDVHIGQKGCYGAG